MIGSRFLSGIDLGTAALRPPYSVYWTLAKQSPFYTWTKLLAGVTVLVKGCLHEVTCYG
jgi:hypothetical protein